MLPKSLFRMPKNPLEGLEKLIRPNKPEVKKAVCPGCKTAQPEELLVRSLYVCPKCGLHHRLGARKRITMTVDEGSFVEWDGACSSKNLLDFPGYAEKLTAARTQSGEAEAVLTGFSTIGGFPCAVFAMDSNFMMGSMGTVVGEKIARCFEEATAQGLPVVGFTVSGGARVQEGVLSLMQMAKTTGAVLRHSQAGRLYVAVLTDPTTGGVDASFAMEADITLAEPGALIGFAGPRVIEQTIRQKLPAGFQRSEFQLDRGFVDQICERRSLRPLLRQILMLHHTGEANA